MKKPLPTSRQTSNPIAYIVKNFTFLRLTLKTGFVLLCFLSVCLNVNAQAPTISYSSPHSYIGGVFINPVTPVTTGGAPAGTYTSPSLIAAGVNACSVAADTAGNVFLADSTKNEILMVPVGSTVAKAIGSGFSKPAAIAVDNAGNVYVADYGNSAIKKIPAGGGATITLATFDHPNEITVDILGNVYYTRGNSTNVKLWKLPVGGGPAVSLNVTDAAGVTADGLGNIYAMKVSGNTANVFKIGTNGTPVSLYNLYLSGGYKPGIAADAAGNIYSSGYQPFAISTIVAATGFSFGSSNITDHPICISAGTQGMLYYIDANFTAKKIKIAGGYFVDKPLPPGLGINNSTGVIYGQPLKVTAAANYTVTSYNAFGTASATVNIEVTRSMPPVISYSSPQTFTGGAPISPLVPTSNGVATQSFLPPVAVLSGLKVNALAVDTAGNLYVADNTNNQVELMPAGGSGPIILGAGFNKPAAIAVDKNGNVYVADYGNNAIKKIPTGGGPVVTLATFDHPTAIAVDPLGNVYFGSYYNRNQNVWKIPVGGGAPVAVTGPYFSLGQIVADAIGNVYFIAVAESNSNLAVYKLAPDGTSAQYYLNYVTGSLILTTDAQSNLYFYSEYKYNKSLQSSQGLNTSLSTVYPVAIAAFGTGVLYEVDNTGVVYKTVLAGGCFSDKPLPGGLQLDHNTGVISGTPNMLSPATTYTISAFNAYGNTSTTVNIAVVAPSLPTVSYNNPQTFYNGIAAAGAPPVSNGVAPPSYSVNPIIKGSGFNGPTDVAIDKAGNVFVADSANNKVEKIPADGGPPIVIGIGFIHPSLVAVNAAGDVFVADYGSNTIKKILAGSGNTITFISNVHPPQLKVDALGNVYAGIAKYDPAGTYIQNIGNFDSVEGFAIDPAGNAYVYGVLQNMGGGLFEIPVGGSPFKVNKSYYTLISGMAVDASGNIYLDFSYSASLKQSPDGAAALQIGGGRLNAPAGLAVDSIGNVYIADKNNNVVKEFKPVGGYYVNPGLPLGLVMNSTTGAVTDTAMVSSPAKNYAVTAYNFGGSTTAILNVQVTNPPPPTISYSTPLTFYKSLTVTPVAPTGTNIAATDISPALPAGLVLNTLNGTISGKATATSPATNYTVTAHNLGGNSSTVVNIQVVLPPLPALSYSTPQNYVTSKSIAPLTPTSSNVDAVGYSSAVTTFGSGLQSPMGIAVDAAGNVYVADSQHNVVKKFPAGGGSPVNIGSGFSVPQGIAVDKAGNVYVADKSNNNVTEIFANGNPQVILGSGFSTPSHLAVDNAGNVYVSDNGNGAVKKISAGNGQVVTVLSDLISPNGIAVDAAGNVYVAETGRNQVIEIHVNHYPLLTTLVLGVAVTELAIDGSGDLFFVEQNTNHITALLLLANGPAYFAVANPANVGGLALSNAGEVFVTNPSSNQITKITPSGGYFVGQPLPFGLIFNNSTGVLSGTPTLSSPAANYTVTAYNVSGGTPALLNIKVTAPDSTSLNTLAINQGALNPQFSADVTSYTANVPNNVTAIGLTAIANLYTATVALNGITTIGAASANISLAAGPNTVNTVVTSPGGTQTKTYSIVITRATTSPTNANLSSLALSAGTLSPAFSPTATTYTTTVNGNTTAITVTPAASAGAAIIKVNGNTVAAGTASPGIPLSVGDNLVKIVVTAPDGTTLKTYKITVTRPAPSSNANLASFVLSSGTIRPAFSTNVISYRDTVAGAVNLFQIIPTTSDANATIVINGSTVASGTQSQILPLVVGDNVITTVVTAQDGTTKKTYTLTVTRPPSSNANLSNLVLSSGTLTPVFAAGTTSYTATVGAGKTSITITPTTAVSTATVKVNGTTVASGSASAAIPMAVGNNIVKVVITAQTGVVKTYTVTITRPVPSVNAGLASLGVSGGVLKPSFATNITSYKDTVAEFTSAFQVTPVTSDVNATIKVNGMAVSSGSVSQFVTLVVGNNIITTVITAQDGTTTKTYALTVTRLPSANADLVSLNLSAGTLSPIFNSNTTSYTASVYAEVTSIKITPATAVTTATVAINGTPVASGAASADIPLSVGSNVINTVVTAQSGAVKTYTVTVTRLAPGKSNIANLVALQISPGTLSPAFAITTQNYTTTVSASSINVYVSSQDQYAAITLNGTAITTNSNTSVPLSTGSNVITIKVTSSDGTTVKTYRITATRDPSVANDNLSNLAVSTGTLSPAFAQATIGYTVAVGTTTTSIQVTPTAATAGEQIKVNNATITSGTASQSIALNVGPNTISTVVTSQDGTAQKTYTVTVNRAASTDATLSSLSINPGTLAPVFASATTNYAASVTNATTTIAVHTVTNQANAAVKVNGIAVSSAAGLQNVPVAVGSNVITVVVTAQDGTTTKTYKVTVTRAASSDANLANLTISSGTLSPAFVKTTTAYTASISNATTAVTVTPTTEDATATVTVNGTAVSSVSPSPSLHMNIGSNVITIKVTAQDATAKTYKITVTRATGPVGVINPGNTSTAFTSTPDSASTINDGITVHRGVSPNGDGVNDYLIIDGINNYPDNKLTIMDRTGAPIFEATNYGNSQKVFDGHSGKTGRLQPAGTYFYVLEYKADGVSKRKTGYIILKY